MYYAWGMLQLRFHGGVYYAWGMLQLRFQSLSLMSLREWEPRFNIWSLKVGKDHTKK